MANAQVILREKIEGLGAEADVVCSDEADIDCEFLIEIGSAVNATRIFDHFRAADRKMWRQGDAWTPVRGIEDMPAHYRQGSLFVGQQP